MAGCYILRSEKLGKFYVGATNDDVQQRLSKHNQGFYGKEKYTSTTDDWELLLFIPTEDYSVALRYSLGLTKLVASDFIADTYYPYNYTPKITSVYINCFQLTLIYNLQ